MCLPVVLYVSLLEPYALNNIRDRVFPPPPPVELDESLEYEVKTISNSNIVHKKLYYFVDWLGYISTD